MITFERFPGKPLVAVNVDGERIGTYEIVEGGFLPQSRKKPRKREADARYLVIVDEATKRLKDATRLMDSVRIFFMAHDIETGDEAEDGDAEYQSWGAST